MGLFKRFKDALRANINELISKAENPEKMLNQIIMDMNEHLIEAKKSVASSIADEKRLERQMNDNRVRVQDWENKAILAVKAGKDDLAKDALLRKEEYNTHAKELGPQWNAQHESVNQLKESLKQLQRKIEEAHRKKNILIARAKRAETQKKIQSMTGSIADTTAFEAFDRMASKVEQIEAEADAVSELNKAGQDEDTLEAEFKKLESSETKADILLDELKTKLRKIEDKSEDSGT